MAGLIEKGRQALVARQQKAAAPAGPLVYTRASDGATVDLTGLAWVGRTAFPVSDGEESESRTIWTDRDYLVPAAALQVGGVPFTPARHDYLTESHPAPEGPQRYEVLPYGKEPEWRYADPQRTVLRVHVKRVA